jgi:hypothetical protein
MTTRPVSPKMAAIGIAISMYNLARIGEEPP